MRGNRNFINLFIFYASFMAFHTFSQSVLPTHYLSQGLDITQQSLGRVILFFSQVIGMPLILLFSSALAWPIALVISIAVILSSIQVFSVGQFYFISFLAGLVTPLFYVFYNTAHFENTPRDKTGQSSSYIFASVFFINIISPLLAGYLKTVNANLVWIISGALFVFSFVLALRQKKFYLRISILKALQEIKSTRFFIFIEGVWEALVFSALPIYALHFIKTPLSYGFYLSYLSLVSIVASVLFGKYTDRIQKRSRFLYPITLILGGATCLFAFAGESLQSWLIIAAVIQFFLPIFWSTVTAFVVDAHTNLKVSIPARELCLGIGRIVGSLAVFFSFTIEKQPVYLFFFLGGMMFLFPITLFWRTRIRKSYKYL